jgi:hypothetical protein
MKIMPKNGPLTSAPPEVRSPEENEGRKVAIGDAASVPASFPALSPEAMAAIENLAPLLVEPETLIQGLRYLQQRIPGFVQLSITEERSMARAAHLDPEILDIGLHAAGAWDETKKLFGWTGEELRQEQEVIRRWDGVIRELFVLAKGAYGANLRRKHRVGLSVLDVYAVLRRSVTRKGSPRAHLRPYVEDMRRAFARLRRKKKPARQE